MKSPLPKYWNDYALPHQVSSERKIWIRLELERSAIHWEVELLMQSRRLWKCGEMFAVRSWTIERFRSQQARIPKVMLPRCSLVVSWYSLDARRLDFDAATYLTDGSNRGFSPGHRPERYQLLLKCHLIHSGKQNQRNPQSPRWLEKEAGKRLLRIITPSTTINVDNQINKAKERKSWWNKQVCERTGYVLSWKGRQCMGSLNCVKKRYKMRARMWEYERGSKQKANDEWESCLPGNRFKHWRTLQRKLNRTNSKMQPRRQTKRMGYLKTYENRE